MTACLYNQQTSFFLRFWHNFLVIIINALHVLHSTKCQKQLASRPHVDMKNKCATRILVQLLNWEFKKKVSRLFRNSIQTVAIQCCKQNLALKNCNFIVFFNQSSFLPDTSNDTNWYFSTLWKCNKTFHDITFVSRCIIQSGKFLKIHYDTLMDKV